MLQELQRGDPRYIGPYKLVGQLGSGGMGRVFLGRSAGGRPVAVKVIRADLAADPDFRARFRREVAAARRVSGLFTAMVVDADLDAAEPWLATAYVPGLSLAETVHDHGPLPASSVMALAAGLAESLAAIHAAGVVHRDLKPSNVLLAEDGPRVIDFGISRAAESTSVTRAGFVIGSPGFMSPEQAEGREVGPPSDMFSLGAVLAFAATGDSPFGGGSTAALVYRIVYGAPNLDDVPAEIRPLVERCLAKDPAQRPTAEALLREVGALQPGEGWLPGPIAMAFPGRVAPVVDVTPPAPPLVTGPEEPPAVPPAEPPAVSRASMPTMTGPRPFIAPEPEAAPPQAPGPEYVPAAAQPVPPAQPAQPVLPVQPEAPPAVPPETGPALDRHTPPITSEPETTPPRAAAMAGEWERETVAAQPRTGPREPETPEGPTPVPGPGADLEPETGPKAPVVPLPWVDTQGERRRPHGRRPLVLGIAAAIIVIASGSMAFALSGSGHPNAAPPAPHTSSASAVVVATTASTQPTTVPTTPTATKTTHRPTAPVSGRANTQPAHTTAPAPTTAPAAVPTTSSPPPRPTPTPTHTHTQAPPPATYSFSVSGASEDSCGVINSVQSSAGQGVNFNFNNNSSGTVLIDEISSSGGLINDATLSPGQQYPASTYVGVYFVVEKSSGSCLAVFKVTGGGQVTIT